ncbi:putative Cell adhesion protein byn-1 [Paratrimastix pyriformis]|uniref:Cell adhesion protein byn-1 n=1 Tax=Paratrimastix pyriformis TaxID=342808 RepID=A0ABQ8U7N8_9EUKA|nr:putative Cell adhesion protein byn-1 [Paratrimastix pyriformis]
MEPTENPFPARPQSKNAKQKQRKSSGLKEKRGRTKVVEEEQQKRPEENDDDVPDDFLAAASGPSHSVPHKMLDQARKQMEEVESDDDEESGRNAHKQRLTTGVHRILKMDSQAGQQKEEEEEEEGDLSLGEEDENIDVRGADVEPTEEITEEDERIMASFLHPAGPQSGPQQPRTLADLIMAKLSFQKQQDEAEAPGAEGAVAGGSSKNTSAAAAAALATLPSSGLSKKAIEVYEGVGKFLHIYRTGKLPQAFKIIPNLRNWEEVLALTNPEEWTPNAMYAATRLFASNLNSKLAQRFYNLVLLPRVREDIRLNKRLNYHLYQSLRKSLYKPDAFFKGILLPLCESGSCTLREAVIVGSLCHRHHIPEVYAAAAIMRLALMSYAGTTSYFLRVLLDKRYNLPIPVVQAVHRHFMRFLTETRVLPLIWFQSLLVFVQRYKNNLTPEQLDELRQLVGPGHQHHALVSPEIKRELSLAAPLMGADQPANLAAPSSSSHVLPLSASGRRRKERVDSRGIRRGDKSAEGEMSTEGGLAVGRTITEETILDL